MFRRAFTLVEIVVVLVVIMVLAALLFPVFGRVRESARRSSCLSNQRQVVAAMQMYVQDNVRLPSSLPPNTFNNLRWDYYQPYAKSPAIFACPSNPETGTYWPRFVPAPKSLMPEARTVVSYCRTHALQGGALPFRGDGKGGSYLDGPYLVARWDGSASVVQGSQTRNWAYQNGDWQLQPTGTLSADAILETRFPGEEWPLNYG